MEKQALKRACRHHKTKAESLKLQNEELTLDLNRTQTELSAWKERSRRNDVEADDNLANLKESERGKNIFISAMTFVRPIFINFKVHSPTDDKFLYPKCNAWPSSFQFYLLL